MIEEKIVARRDELTTEEQLQILFELQSVDSKIDKIRLLQGSLPLEVSDLEDEIEGLGTRVRKLEGEIAERQEQISQKKQEIKTSEALVKKYSEQMKNVRNNREYDSLSKEVEFHKLEVELSNKNIREIKQANESLNLQVEEVKSHIAERELDLEVKRKELENIVAETACEMEQHEAESKILIAKLPDRLRDGYLRIRKNARNGLAVVSIVRGACGGCFNRIPPQRQIEIRMKKKIIVCEYCGRIIVDNPGESQEAAE